MVKILKISIFFLLICQCGRLCSADPDSKLIKRAHELYFQGKLDDSLAIYKKVASGTNKRSQALKNMAVIHRDKGELTKAISVLIKAHELDPKDADVLEQLAWFSYLKADYTSAKTHAVNALALSAGTLSIYAFAASLASSQEYSKAEVALNRFIKDSPHFLPAYLDLGRIYEVQRKWNKAKITYKEALKIDPAFAETRVHLAGTFKELKQSDEEIRQYAEIKKVDTRHPEVKKSKSQIKAITDAVIATGRELFSKNASSKFSGSAVPLAKNRESLPRIRIGLGASVAGKPLPMAGLLFMAGDSFRIYDKKTGSIITRGKRHEAWRIEVRSKKTGICLIHKPKSKSPVRFNGPIVIKTETSTSTILVHGVKFGHGFSWEGSQDREYRDLLEIIPDKRAGIIMVNDIVVEEYLYSVLPSEMPISSPPEAFKAQAIVARTDTLFRKKRNMMHKRHPYDLCDTQHCQVYAGITSERPKARRAVNKTRGIILTHKKRPINALYHANCGGHTITASKLPGWWGAPYLQGVFDGPGKAPSSPWEMDFWIKGKPAIHCAASKHVHKASSRWIWSVSRKELQERVNRKARIGKLLHVESVRRIGSGHLLGVKFIGSKGRVIIRKEHELKRLLAIGQTRSVLLALDPSYNNKKELQRVYIFGGGWGHGVGLCQGGAANLAENKKSFKDILLHYYTGVEFKQLDY
ncbi:SpoIID/LytB domain-containing protein [Elusimicrobiota bacterium]